MDTRATTSELIAAAADRLTPTERRIAEAVLAEPTLIAFGTVSDLAGTVGTSRPSIVRFAHKLGFDGYTDLQGFVRENLSEQITRPSQRIRHEATDPTPRAVTERAVAAVFDVLDGDRLASLVAPIVGARTVWIVTGETSRAGAVTLASGLSMIRPGVRLLEGSGVPVAMADAGPGDVVVAFDFPRYRTAAVRTVGTLADAGVDVVAITDGPLSPFVAHATAWCGLSVPAIGPFDSSVPAVIAAELIVAQVAGEIHGTATDRIDRIEELWDATGTFLPAE